MAIVDSRSSVESNSKIPNTFGDINEFFSDIPKSSGIVMEASSVSEEIFLRLRDSGFKPVLANPFRTKVTDHAKIKTDKRRRGAGTDAPGRIHTIPPYALPGHTGHAAPDKAPQAHGRRPPHAEAQDTRHTAG